MDVELLEIRDFLAARHPLRDVPEAVLTTLTKALSIRYARRGTTFPVHSAGAAEPSLGLVRAGAVEVRSAAGEPLARRGEGEFVGARVAALDGALVVALEDTLLYALPLALVERLGATCAALAILLEPPGAQRLRGAPRPADAAPATANAARTTTLDLLTTTLRDVVVRAPVQLPPTATIRATAERMSAEHVTSMLIVEAGRLTGIVTDRDLRLRVVVAGLDSARPVADIMSADPIRATLDTLAHEALLRMARHRIHHLPVLDGEAIAGVVTASDFVERRATSAIRLAADLYRRDSVAALARERPRVPALFAGLVRTGASAARVARVASDVVDAFTIRLLELAERELGPPPLDYVWLVAGAQARREWSVGAAQASALLLGDDYSAGAHGAYFEALARRVRDGLEACGQSCASDAWTAATAARRLTLAGWRHRLTRRLQAPRVAADMPDEMLFDLRAVYGPTKPLERLRHAVLAPAGETRARLAAALVVEALSHRPPLGFFRERVLSAAGEATASLDLVTDALAPIVDLARASALATGTDPTNTHERLAVAATGATLDAGTARDLDDALRVVATLRARHHAQRIADGATPEDRLSPGVLSGRERDHLEDAFAIVRAARGELARRHDR